MPRRKATTPDRLDNPWPHRTAWVLTVAALVVTSIGGLVTSYQAWVAMPTRDASGQYDPFSFYPPARWLADGSVLLEHTHRLSGAALAVVAIRDALGVRRSVGEEGLILNEVAKHLNMRKKTHIALGHTPLQVLVGAILGIIVALAVFYI